MKYFSSFLFLFVIPFSYAQEKDYTDRNYTGNLHLYGGTTYVDVLLKGFGPNVGAMKELNRWFSLGLDFTYQSFDSEIEVTTFPPLTITRPGYDRNHFILTPRVQFSPFRPTEKIRFYVIAGTNLRYYSSDQNWPDRVETDQFWTLGYDYGVGFNFHNVFDERITIIPTGTISRDFNPDKYIDGGGGYQYPRGSLSIAYEIY